MKKTVIYLISSIALVVAILGALYFARYYKPAPPAEVYIPTPTPTVTIKNNHIQLNEEEMGSLLSLIINEYLNVEDLEVKLSKDQMEVNCSIQLDDAFTNLTGIQIPLTGKVKGGFQCHVENSINIIVDGGSISIMDMPVEAKSIIQSGLQKACIGAGVTKIELGNGTIDFYGTNLDSLVN